MGIIAAIAGMGLAEGVRSYLFTRMTVESVQQAQLALARMRLEFMNMEAPTAGDANSITFTSDGTRRYGGGNGYAPGTTYRFNRNGTQIDLSVTPPGGTNTIISNLGTYGADGASNTFLGYTANTATVPSGTMPVNFRDLKVITLRLFMSRTDGNGALTFVTAVNPRNNGLANGPEPIPGGQ
jgi:hypothetical protein